ncbi:MAG: response regulator [Planctomycetes bacterium]|nr:response regulator [Planctomycetota bacterium]
MSTPLQVLILEDRPVDAALLLARLREAGFAPQWTHVDNEADYVAQLDPALDVILADYSLPQFDAPSALRILQQRALNVPFIIVSGTIGEDVAVAAMRAGATDYLLKDRLSRLGQAVRQAMERRQLGQQHRQTQESLELTQQRFGHLLHASPTLAYAVHLESEASQLIWGSDNIFRWTGFTPEEARAPDWWPTQVHPDDLQHASRFLERLLIHEQCGDEYRIRDKNGEYHWVYDEKRLIRDSQGKPVELAILSLDLCGKVTAWNAAAQRIFGWTEQEVLGHPVPYVPADKQAEFQELFSQELAGGELVGFETQRLRKDGSRVETRFFTAPLYDPQHKVSGSLALVADITEQKRMEEQFRQSQKMEAIGRLAGGVAHDFNNMLTIILGYTDVLLDNLSQHDSRREAVLAIDQASQRAAKLTKQLLAFSRQQVLQLQVFDINAIVRGLIDMLKRLLGEDVALAVALDPHLSSVRADSAQLEQVLLNLAVNARDAMPHGGHLTFETCNVVLDADYASRFADVRAGQYVLLSVSDSGHGMEPATLARIFEPFFTTKAQGKGTGLGLAMAFGMVHQCGGHISASSEPGQGTTFKLYLPAVAGAAAAPEVISARQLHPHGTETVLLVEDEAALRTLTGRILRGQGYTVLEARDGNEALIIWADHGPSIDLLLTDVVMPQMSGRELADRLRALKPELKVLFVSGYAEDAIVRHGILEANIPFLQKPFTAEVLAQRLRQTLDHKPER